MNYVWPLAARICLSALAGAVSALFVPAQKGKPARQTTCEAGTQHEEDLESKEGFYNSLTAQQTQWVEKELSRVRKEQFVSLKDEIKYTTEQVEQAFRITEAAARLQLWGLFEARTT